MNMKKNPLFYIVLILGIVLGTFSLQSCLNDDDTDYPTNIPNALVTIKTNSSTGQVYFQLNDETTILPTNMKTSPYGKKELRALTNIKVQDGKTEGYSKSVYGKDPVEIVKDWTTVVEDGYLTLRFRTYFGNGKKHVVTLVKGDNPYEVVLHHNASGDTKGLIRDGLVAFRLSDLPDTQGKTVDLTLKWQSFSGVKTVKFKYKSRK